MDCACEAATWMTKVLPAILPMLLAFSSSRVASMTPRPVAYSLPNEPCSWTGFPAIRQVARQKGAEDCSFRAAGLKFWPCGLPVTQAGV